MRKVKVYLSSSYYERSTLSHTCTITSLTPWYPLLSAFHTWVLALTFGITCNPYNPSPTWLAFSSLKITAITCSELSLLRTLLRSLLVESDHPTGKCGSWNWTLSRVGLLSPFHSLRFLQPLAN